MTKSAKKGNIMTSLTNNVNKRKFNETDKKLFQSLTLIVILFIAYILGGVSIPLYSYKYDKPVCYENQDYRLQGNGEKECEYYEDYCFRAFRIDKCEITSNKIPYSSDTALYQKQIIGPA